MGQRPIGVGAGEQHQHVGPGGKGAPGLDAVDQPSSIGRRGGGDDAGDVRTEIRLGDGHGGEHFRRGQFGEPVLLLLFGAPVDQCPGEDLGPCDQGTADAERSPTQLFGGHDHAHVVTLATGGEAVVLLGDRESEPAEFGQATDDLFGDIAIGAMHMLCMGAHLVLGEAMERLANELEVAPEMPRTLDVGQRSQGGRIAPGRHQVGRRGAPPGLRLPRPPLVPPRDRPDRPRRRPRTRWPGAPRSRPGRRRRARRARWPRRQPRGPGHRRRPDWRRRRRWRARRHRPDRPGVGPGRRRPTALARSEDAGSAVKGPTLLASRPRMPRLGGGVR